MRHLILLLPLFLMGCDQVNNAMSYVTAAGPSQYVQPCYVEEVINVDGKAQARALNIMGYQHREVVEGKTRIISHCLPCEKARSKGEVLACNGEGK